MILTLAMQAAVFIMAPDLPVFSDATFDEAAARFWPASAMVLVVADKQYTQQDWDRSFWADPKVNEFFRSERVPVVYADIEEDRAATWLLDLDRLPAVIIFVGNQERARRYGLQSGGSDDLIAWYTIVRSGTTPAKQLRERIAAEPGDVALRWELIRELDRSGKRDEMRTEIGWFLRHPDRFVMGDQEEPVSEPANRLGLLWFIASMREKLGFSYDDPRPDISGKLADDPDEAWRAVARLTAAQDTEDRQARSRIHLARVAMEIRETLDTRVREENASERDRFVLEALTASEDQFRRLYERVQREADGESD